MVYCVVPPEVAARVRRLVERALRDEPEVVIVEERRASERLVYAYLRVFRLVYRAAGGGEWGRSLTPALAGRQGGFEPSPTEGVGLGWQADEDLPLLIGRRPAAERHRGALRALETTLSAVTRSPRVAGRHPMSRLGHQTPVLTRRRRALLAA
jgi:hypothetical protein